MKQYIHLFEKSLMIGYIKIKTKKLKFLKKKVEFEKKTPKFGEFFFSRILF